MVQRKGNGQEAGQWSVASPERVGKQELKSGSSLKPRIHIELSVLQKES